MFDRKTISYPAKEGNADEVTYAELSDILTEPADFDAHFTAYSYEAFPHRMNKGAFGDHEIPVVLLVFDVDDPVAHANDTPARPEWYAAEAFKISALLRAHDGFIYHTKGGYRIVAGWLPEPFVVSSHADAALWTALYQTHVKALKRRFNIEADTRCGDWQRLYRIPRACRDGAVQELPSFGDPRTIGTYSDEFWQDEDVVEPESVIQAAPRPSMRTSPPIMQRIYDASALALTLKPAVQGAGAEDALWAACNEVLVGFDLDVDSAFEIIETVYLPRCDVTKLGPEHFLDRARKKLEELNESAEKPYGWRVDARKLTESVAKTASKNGSSEERVSNHSAKLSGIPPRGADDARQDSETGSTPEPSLAQILEAFSPDVQPIPTPFETLNKITRGGLRPKAVVALAGAPGAGKTSLAVQLGAHFLETGVPVCMLAGDESIEFLLGRLAQRKGITRDDIEEGRAHAKDALLKAAEAWRLLALDCDWPKCTVEYAATRLHELHGPGVLIVDSVQKTRTDTSHEADTVKGRVDDVIATLKQVAARFGHVVIATSEINRSAYRSKDAGQNVEDIAAAKESGDIEYGVKMLLVLKEAKDEDHVDVTTPKNRLGRGKPKWRLRWDYVRATFTETKIEDEPAPEVKQAKELESVEKQVLAHIKEFNQLGKSLSSKNQIFQTMSRMGRGKNRNLVWAAIGNLELDSKLSKASGHYEALV